MFDLLHKDRLKSPSSKVTVALLFSRTPQNASGSQAAVTQSLGKPLNVVCSHSAGETSRLCHLSDGSLGLSTVSQHLNFVLPVDSSMEIKGSEVTNLINVLVQLAVIPG